MQFNFGSIEPRTKNGKGNKNFGKPRSRKFNLKYQVGSTGTSRFTVSIKLWEQLGLDNGKGLMFAKIPNGTGEEVVVMGLVSETDHRCSLFTKSKSPKGKTKYTHSKNLEEDLTSVGVLNVVEQKLIINGKPNIQRLDLKLIQQEDIPEGVDNMYVVIRDNSENEVEETVVNNEVEISDEVEEETIASNSVEENNVSQDQEPVAETINELDDEF